MSGSSHGEVVIIDETEMEIVQHEDLPSSKEKKSMLSMLAEVASATLSTPNAKNKTSQMTLDQIKALKPSTLVDLFAIYKTDEAGTKFCYMCRLLPDKCRAAFWSHTGNEVRARQLMQSHLSEHIQEIERDAGVIQVEEEDQIYENSEVIEVIEISGRQRTNSSSSATLSASEVEDNDEEGEPLFRPHTLNPLETGDDWTVLEELGDHFYTHPCGPAEVPREKYATTVIKIDADGTHHLNPEPPVCISTPPWPSIYTPLLPNISEIENIRAEPIPESSSEEEEEEEPEAVSVQYVVEQAPQEQYNTTTRYVYEGTAPTVEDVYIPHRVSGVTRKENMPSSRTTYFTDASGVLYECQENSVAEAQEEVQAVPSTSSQPRTMHIVVDQETGEEYAVEYQEESDQYVEDVSYQSTSREYEGVGDSENVVVYADGSQEYLGEIEHVEWTEEEVAEQEISTNFSPFEGKVQYQQIIQPRQMKSRAGNRSRQVQIGYSQVAEEQVNIVGTIQTDEASRNHNGRVIPEWEKQLAINYLKALNERTEPDFVLQCKICNNNKTYTAAATLISHYRGHAGIKPFTCQICGATFTRQHSLKYHLLIHNNASRFTCTACSRQFRHPSHYKEHLRRHTGETPFECSDCPQRFKTRNTYKRHLKTRHKKLLSKDGITVMEYAEGDPEGEVAEMVVIKEEDDDLL